MTKKKKNQALKIQPSNQVRDVSITVGDLLQCTQALNALKNMGIKRGKGADRMIKFMGIISEELKDIDKARNALIIAHGKEQPNGTHAIDENDKAIADAYVKELNELLDQEIEIRLRPPSFDCLGGDTIPGILSDLKIFFEVNEEDQIPDKIEPIIKEV